VTAPLRAAILRHPLGRRIAGYSAGSVIAVIVGEACFVAVFGGLHGGTTWATAAGFVGGAVPNYVLNRRWAWSDRNGRSRQAEIGLYTAVVGTSFAANAIATHWAETFADRLSPSAGWETVMVASAYLLVSGLFFVVKFVLYEVVVFAPRREPADSERVITLDASAPLPGASTASLGGGR